MKDATNGNELLRIAIEYKKKFGLDFIPLRIEKANKRPNVKKWKLLQDKEQTIGELIDQNWNNANGIGMINKKVATIDFDKCADENFIREIMNDLGGKYWFVKTGFGYHLHIMIEQIEYLELLLGIKGVYRFKPNEKGILDHAELRVKNCYCVFPHSKHYNGNIYSFIDGEPECLPEKINAKKLLDVLKKYFIIDEKSGSNTTTEEIDEFFNSFSEGVEEGERHNTLIRLFGSFYSRGNDKKYILQILKDWNRKNRPPYSDKEITKQINDLFRRYDKGLDGVFLEFNGCLLQLQDEDELKLKKIICFAVVEFGGDKDIITELKLQKKIKKYHNECKKFVEKYENWSGHKDQIVRVGKTLLLDTLNRKIQFDYFCIYVGILSYLGRNRQKPAKKIAYSIIRFRAMGFKNEEEYLLSESKIPPVKQSRLKSAIQFLEKANFIRTFIAVKGQMRWFSTFLPTYESLAEYAKRQELKKIEKYKRKEEIRLRVLDEIKDAKKELKNLKNTKIDDLPSSPLHLLSNEN